MGTCERGQLPADLVRVRTRFHQWRGRRRPADRIPQELREMAVRLANTHGVSRTALAPVIDYYRFKERAEGAAGVPHASGPAFVEVTSSVMVAPRRPEVSTPGRASHKSQ
jgi:hypothetical protein